MNKARLLTLFTATVLSLLTACSSTPQQTSDNNPASKQPEQISKKPMRETKPFESQTLYSLLVAEIAGQRKRYDIFLGNYMQQAHQTRDPEVAERATQIARYLHADQAALNGALLWSDITPENNEAQSIAAYELAKAGRIEEAIVKVQLLLDRGTQTQVQPITVMALKARNESRKSYESAIDNMLINHPENQSLLISKALLLQRNSKFVEALPYAEQALDLDEKNYQAAILNAKLLEQLKQTPNAVKVLEKALRRSPENHRVRIQYARLLSTFDTPKAQEQFTLLLTQSPENPALVLSLALVKKENGQLDDAIKLLQRLIKMGKLTSSAYYYLGQIAEEQNRLEDALASYEQITGGPDLFSAMTRYGTILLKQNELDRFSKRLVEIREISPKIGQRLFLLESELLVEFDKHQIAYDKLTAALEDHPMDTNLLYARSMVAERMNNIAGAESDLRKIIATTPNSADALNALGYTLADKTDRYEEARELIERALSIRPNDPAIMDSLGWVEFRLGNYETSLLRLRSAFAEFPDHEVGAHLGEVLWTLKQYEEAKKVWRKALELKPDSKIIPTVVRRLVENPEEILER